MQLSFNPERTPVNSGNPACGTPLDQTASIGHPNGTNKAMVNQTSLQTLSVADTPSESKTKLQHGGLDCKSASENMPRQVNTQKPFLQSTAWAIGFYGRQSKIPTKNTDTSSTSISQSSASKVKLRSKIEKGPAQAKKRVKQLNKRQLANEQACATYDTTRAERGETVPTTPKHSKWVIGSLITPTNPACNKLLTLNHTQNALRDLNGWRVTQTARNAHHKHDTNTNQCRWFAAEFQRRTLWKAQEQCKSNGNNTIMVMGIRGNGPTMDLLNANSILEKSG
eukprot:jgi/Psemu1/23639/gm1.23639_g